MPEATPIRRDRATRTETDVLRQEPLQLRFGSIEYAVPVLTVLKARKWRAEMVKAVSEIATQMNQTLTGQEQFFNGLAFALLQFPEKLSDLIFAYAPELSRAEIEECATEEQLAVAFSQIMEVAFPFTRQLGMISQVLKSAADASVS